ncbi:hypothetical protein PG994_002154 [Apiospora phragmitis]|uniref:Uncharacterized protein n=1 Tax=Apiospora phragmitis TaxID=2905665 RepID=A0ABR1WVL2_9PEZI
MGDPGSPPDINVSNGTCYYAEHEETKGNFIACGNVAFGHWPCCQAGDIRLHRCRLQRAGVPLEVSLFHGQEWVAIQLCHAGAGDDDTIWGGCKVDANQTTLEKLPHASCDPYCSSTVLKGASVLPAFASLPNSAGGSIKWTSGFDPTATAAGVKPANATSTTTANSSPTPTTGSSSRGSSITTPPTTTAAPSSTPGTTASSSDESGLTVGAKAGIGVGAAGAVLLIVAVVFLGLLVRRRKQRRNSQNNLETNSAPHHPHPHPHQYDVAPPEQQQQQQDQVMYYNYNLNKTPPPPTTTVRPTLNSQDSQPYVGYKAELSAEEAQQRGPWDQQTGVFKSELAADETTMPRNEIGSSGRHDSIIGGATKGEPPRGGAGGVRRRNSSSGAHGTPGSGGGGGLSPFPSPHPSSAATVHSPYSTYSEVSTLYASSGGGSGGGGTGRWAPPPPTPPQQQQQRHGDHPLNQEWPLPRGHGGSAQRHSFRERQQGRGGTWRSHGYDPS